MQSDRNRKSKDEPIQALISIKGVNLSRREIDIIACILGGRATKKIASILNISSRTVETHIYNILTKLKSNSREGIIDFIEKSGAYSLIKDHYTNLIIKELFEDKLRKIAKLNKVTPMQCLLLHDDEDNQSNTQRKILIDHLKLCNIQTYSQQVNDNIEQKSLETKNIILCLPKILTNKQKAEDLLDISEKISMINEKYQTAPVFILHSFGNALPFVLPKKSNIIYLNIKEEIDYCISFFAMLSKFELGLHVDHYLSEFKSESLIQGELKEEVDNHNPLKYLFNPDNEKMKWSIIRWVALLSLLLLVVIFLGFFKFDDPEEESLSKNINNKSQEIHLINDEINAAIKQSDDLIESLDVLDLKPRIILLNEDVDQYLKSHLKVEESLNHTLKNLETLMRTVEDLGGDYRGLLSFMKVFSNSKTYVSTMKRKILNDLEIQIKIIKVVIAINNGLLLYMSNTNYPPDEKESPNYSDIVKEFQKALYTIHTLGLRANSKKYQTYIERFDNILGNNSQIQELIKKEESGPTLTIVESQGNFLDKCFLIALNNSGMVLRTRGDIGESSQESAQLYLDCNKRFSTDPNLGESVSKENIAALCKFYVSNEFGQKAYKQSLALFGLANEFREKASLSINFEPIILTQMGEVIKRIYNDGFNASENTNLNEAINFHTKAYLKNTENIVVLNGYAKSLLDQIEKQISLNKIRERNAHETLNQINVSLRKLGFPLLTMNEDTPLERFMQSRNELNDKLFKIREMEGRDALIEKIDSLTNYLMERYQFKLDINKFFDIAERAFLYALQKCDRGNAILEVNLAYLRFIKSLALNENTKASREKTEEILSKIQGGKKDEHKTLLFHKATLQLKQKRYLDGLNTLHHYEYLGGNMNHPYLLYIRALLRLGIKDYAGANKDLARSIEVNQLYKLYFKDKDLMPVVRFDEYIINSDDFLNNICNVMKDIGKHNSSSANKEFVGAYCTEK